MSDFFNPAPDTTRLDLPAFFDSSVTDGLIGLLELGVLVSFGVTRDGGAIGIAVFDDGRRRREYFRHTEDAADWLRLAVSALSGPGNGSRTPEPATGQNPTRGAWKAF